MEHPPFEDVYPIGKGEFLLPSLFTGGCQNLIELRNGWLSIESMMNQIFTQGFNGWKSPNNNIYKLVVWSSGKDFADVLGC